MTVQALEEMPTAKDPNWILDRRNSGKLFWRRDSVSEKRRVKFRCDVEVVEFLRSEAERAADWSSEDEEDEGGKEVWRRRPWEEEIPPPNSVWGGVCLLLIVAVLTYQWFSV